MQQEEKETESQETDNDAVALAEFTSEDGWEEYQFENVSVMVISETTEVKKNAVSLSEDDLNGHIVKLKAITEDLISFW